MWLPGTQDLLLRSSVWTMHARAASHLWSKFGLQLLASFIHCSHFARLLSPFCSTRPPFETPGVWQCLLLG